jgi:hypothetical protein
MAGSKKKYRLVILLLLAVGLGALALLRFPSQPVFPTPSDCLTAFYEAVQEGNVSNYLRCLDDPLLADMKRQALSQADWVEILRRETVKNWVQDRQPLPEGPSIMVEVDEVRSSGTERVRFRLEQRRQGWRIVGIQRLEQRRPSFPYGTDIRAEPANP